jgi:hypothetical protein
VLEYAAHDLPLYEDAVLQGFSYSRVSTVYKGKRKKNMELVTFCRDRQFPEDKTIPINLHLVNINRILDLRAVCNKKTGKPIVMRHLVVVNKDKSVCRDMLEKKFKVTTDKEYAAFTKGLYIHSADPYTMMLVVPTKMALERGFAFGPKKLLPSIMRKHFNNRAKRIAALATATALATLVAAAAGVWWGYTKSTAAQSTESAAVQSTESAAVQSTESAAATDTKVKVDATDPKVTVDATDPKVTADNKKLDKPFASRGRGSEAKDEEESTYLQFDGDAVALHGQVDVFSNAQNVIGFVGEEKMVTFSDVTDKEEAEDEENNVNNTKEDNDEPDFKWVETETSIKYDETTKLSNGFEFRLQDTTPGNFKFEKATIDDDWTVRAVGTTLKFAVQTRAMYPVNEIKLFNRGGSDPVMMGNFILPEAGPPNYDVTLLLANHHVMHHVRCKLIISQ